MASKWVDPLRLERTPSPKRAPVREALIVKRAKQLRRSDSIPILSYILRHEHPWAVEPLRSTAERYSRACRFLCHATSLFDPPLIGFELAQGFTLFATSEATAMHPYAVIDLGPTDSWSGNQRLSPAGTPSWPSLGAARLKQLFRPLHPEQLLAHGRLEVRHQELHPQGHLRRQIQGGAGGSRLRWAKAANHSLNKRETVLLEPPVIRPIRRG